MYATITIDGHRESWSLKSRGFRDWLSHEFYKHQGRAPSGQSIQDALSVLTGKARFEGSSFDVHTRLAEYNGAIFLDLCDRDWRVVRISEEGWDVISESQVKFRRTKEMPPLPEPSRNGNINLLRQFVNVSTDDWPLLLGWLVNAFRPGKPFLFFF